LAIAVANKGGQIPITHPNAFAFDNLAVAAVIACQPIPTVQTARGAAL
jgi:hypothetical protein